MKVRHTPRKLLNYIVNPYPSTAEPLDFGAADPRVPTGMLDCASAAPRDVLQHQ
jgi:hypothetical protein